jgi:hypothetical protein
MKLEQKNLIILILAIALAGGAGFVGGLKYQEYKLQTAFKNGFQRTDLKDGMGTTRQNGQANTAGNKMMGIRPIAGEIISLDDKSLTIKSEDGSSKIVLISDTTTYNQETKADKSDITTGKQVTVIGSSNPDGSVTATSVQIR